MKINRKRLKQLIKEELKQQKTLEEQGEDLVMVQGYGQLLRRQVKRKLAEMLKEAAEDALEGKYPHLDAGVIQALHAALKE